MEMTTLSPGALVSGDGRLGRPLSVGDLGAPQWNNWAPEKLKKIETECRRGKHDWRGNFIISANGRGHAVQGKGVCANCDADLQQTLRLTHASTEAAG